MGAAYGMLRERGVLASVLHRLREAAALGLVLSIACGVLAFLWLFLVTGALVASEMSGATNVAKWLWRLNPPGGEGWTLIAAAAGGLTLGLLAGWLGAWSRLIACRRARVAVTRARQEQ